MRRKILPGFAVLFLCVAVVAGAWLFDPINRLQLRFWMEPGWPNGIWSMVHLGPSATPEEIVNKAPSSSKEGVNSPPYQITEIKYVYGPTGDDGSILALLDSGNGRKIAVMKYTSPDFGWFYRTYDVSGP